MTYLFILAALLLGPGTAFGKGTAVLTFHHHKIIAEVAETKQEQETGLMNRKTLPENHGMLFVFHDNAVRYFWMKNTLIPLDIAFLDNHGKIVTLKTMKPLSTEIVSSEKPSRYALEVNAGLFRRLHAHPGEFMKLIRKGDQVGHRGGSVNVKKDG